MIYQLAVLQVLCALRYRCECAREIRTSTHPTSERARALPFHEFMNGNLYFVARARSRALRTPIA